MLMLHTLTSTLQAGLINHDKKMVDPSTGVSALCRSTNLCQELGQIEYVFSDKTGTLTQNIMTFKSLSVGGTVYVPHRLELFFRTLVSNKCMTPQLHSIS